ncbi:MAG TPA: hypothetical protein VL752_00545 [Acidisoma sp.]|uniref:hypothetical protein n=1 Tax=Acidisoma sp. TaxID=1872115 RepID=UPI002C69F11C|nr:hypothetical protein [Acidisoma sp.]HTH99403.1 hypothetical protein [Acidisoma sp.]
MARLSKVEGTGLHPSGQTHDEIDNARTFYFEEPDGPIFQINTYGRTVTRTKPGKLSQTLQLTRVSARQLIAQLEDAFPGILEESANK